MQLVDPSEFLFIVYHIFKPQVTYILSNYCLWFILSLYVRLFYWKPCCTTLCYDTNVHLALVLC